MEVRDGPFAIGWEAIGFLGEPARRAKAVPSFSITGGWEKIVVGVSVFSKHAVHVALVIILAHEDKLICIVTGFQLSFVAVVATTSVELEEHLLVRVHFHIRRVAVGRFVALLVVPASIHIQLNTNAEGKAARPRRFLVARRY